MDELERKVARAAIQAPPAESPNQLAANIAHSIEADAATVGSLLTSLCNHQVLIRQSSQAGNLSQDERDKHLVKLYYEKGPQLSAYMTSLVE